MKRFLSCLLCVTFILSFASVAFAADTPAILKAYVTGGTEDIQGYKTEIESITFTKSAVGTNAVNDSEAWDVSAAKDGSVKAWLEDADRNGLYEAYITAEGANNNIYANPDSSYLFEGFSALKSINGMNLFITDNVRYMRSMFAGCSSLEALDLQYFGMASAVTAEAMFENCKSLSTIPGFERLNTSALTNMSKMFSGCESLEKLDMRTWDTSNVTDMSFMFYNCKNLESCDFGYTDSSADSNFIDNIVDSSFSTKNVTDMSYMFSGCKSLKKLNLNGFDTNKLTTISKMFYGCSSLESLDLSTWNFAGLGGKTLALYEFLSGCRSLKSLYVYDISGYNVEFYDYQKNFDNVSGVKIYIHDKYFDQSNLWASVFKYMQGSSIIFSDHLDTRVILTFTVPNGVSYYAVSEIGSEDEDFVFGDETRTYIRNTKLKIRLYGSYPEYTFYVNGEAKTVLREEVVYILADEDASVYAVGKGLSEDIVGEDDKNLEGEGDVAKNFLGVFAILYNRIVEFFRNLFSFIKF